MIETLDNIIEDIANLLGAYGCGDEFEPHPNNCPCRICFTSKLTQRIEAAVQVERHLELGRSTEEAGGEE